MSGLPRVAVLGVDSSGAAATIALVDGGLTVTAFSAGPAPDRALADLAAHGLDDRVIVVAPGTLRLGPPDDRSPTYKVLGVPVEAPAGAPAAASTNTARADDPTAGPDPRVLGQFDAVVLTEPTAGLAVAGPAAPRFAEVFDLAGSWTFQVTGPDELAQAQARWVGEYLRGRYALPADPVMATRPQLAARSLRGGVRGHLTALERELRAGHARAAEAGYPLPKPPTSTPSPGPVDGAVRDGQW